MPPRTSVPGVSTDNIIEGGRKRGRNDDDAQASPLLGSSSTLRSSTRTPIPDAKSKEKAIEQGFRLLDFLVNRIDSTDQTPLCIPYLTLPSKTEFPDYYEQIKAPMSFEKVRRKLQSRQFDSFDEIRTTIETIWRNAKKYNVKESEIYEIARVYHGLTRDAYETLLDNDQLPSVDDGGLQESSPSLMEQSAKIEKIETKNTRARLDYDQPARGPPIVSLRLKKSGDLPYEEDLEPIPEKVVNMPAPNNSSSNGVQVEQEQPVKQEDTEMADLETNSNSTKASTSHNQNNSSSTIPSTDLKPQSNGNTSHSSLNGNSNSITPSTPIAAPSQPTTSSSSSSSTSGGGGGGKKKRIYAPRGKRLKSKLRQLVSGLKLKENNSGKLLCEDFMDLPTKAELPEYYKVIKEPISMRMIDEKSMRNGYETAFSLFTDLRLMVSNAKQFNEDDSEIWKTADQIGDYIENSMAPELLAENFTLHPEDDRESVLPGDVFDPVAHAAAKLAELESSDESPEPPPSATKRGKSSSSTPVAHPNVQPSWQDYARSHGYMDSPYGMSAMRGQQGQSRPNGQQQPKIQPQNGYPIPPGYPVNAAMSPPIPGGGPHPGFPAGVPPYPPGAISPFSGPPAINGIPPHSAPIVRSTRRLNGEAPPDPYDVATLLLPDGSKWKRKPTCPDFFIQCRGFDGRVREKYVTNHFTHYHSIGVGSMIDEKTGENAMLTIEFRLSRLVRKDEIKDEEEKDENLKRPWKVSALYNGSPLDIKTESESNIEIVSQGGVTEVAQGRKCSISVRPTLGNSVLNITITPSAPDSTLSAIASDMRHPLSSRARTLLSLPDKYRIFLNCA